MRTEYGTTWWGQRWLAALEQIDQENRIPRGKTYANTGKVFSFKIHSRKKEITAKVQGRYRPSYSVTIRLPEIPQEKIDKLIEGISKSPLILAKLAARELDPEILKIAQSCGIELFPKRWSDLGMHCTCPDYAVPCKHIAAVIYTISQEIDSNPFKIFELRGIDLIKELEKRGITIGKATRPEIPTWEHLLNSANDFSPFLPQEEEEKSEENAEPIVEKVPLLAYEPEEPLVAYEPEETPLAYEPEEPGGWLNKLRILSFKSVDFDSAAMVALLEEKPAGFIYGNLREQVSNFLKVAVKIASNQRTSVSERTPPTWSRLGPLLEVTAIGWTRPAQSLEWEEFSPVLGKLEKVTITKARANGSKVMLHEMFSGYSNPKRLAESPEGIEGLYHIWVIATKFVMASAIEPLLFEPRQGFIRIQWFPSRRTEKLARIVEQVGTLAKNLIPEVLQIQNRPEDISASVLGEIILGAFIESYMEATFDEIDTKKPYQSLEEQILFGPFAAELALEPRLEGISLRMAEWLAPLSRPSSNIRPVLTIRDDIEIKAEDLAEAFDRPVSIELSFQLPVPDYRENLDIRKELVPLNEVLRDPKWSSARFEVMQLTARLSRYCQDLELILRNQGQNVVITMEQLTPLMFKALPALRLLGVLVVLPRSLRSLLMPEVQLSIQTPRDVEAKGFLDLMSMLDWDWKLAIGDQTISTGEFLQLAKNAGKIVRFRDKFMYVDSTQIAKIQRRLEGKDKDLTRNDLIRAVLTEEAGGCKVVLSKEAQKAFAALLNNDEIKVPKGLEAELRDYQKRGYSWLLRNFRIGLGSILADDMGLGKTVQVIGFLEALREEGILEKKPALIIIPTSLIENWKKELQKFAPKLTGIIYYGSGRTTNFKGVHLVITTYGTLRSSVEALKKVNFSILVLDEVQAIKNYMTTTAKSVKQIKRQCCVAMSGTPVENSLTEYWSIMDATNSGILGTVNQFKELYARPIEIDHSEAVANRFKKLTAPFIMRREKTDKAVIADLPEKITINEYCSLTKEQAALYKARVERDIRKLELGLTPGERSALLLGLITALKQICNSPAQYEPSSSFNRPEDSGKMIRVLEILEELRAAGRKVLIFTQYVQMGKLLQNWIEERTGKRPSFIHGGTKERQAVVDSFQQDRGQQVLILSLNAAGTGLNIQAASAVIHYDLWWNPAREDQATDRAYRIGQEQDVNVYRMICANTFEDKINEIIDEKKKIAKMTVKVGEDWIGDLSNDELKEIFTLEV